jgi:protein SCO1/2
MQCRIWLFALLAAAPVWAQPGTPAAMRTNGVRTNATVEGKLPGPLQKAKIEQKLDAQLPLDLELSDESGVRRPLRSYLRGKPVVFSLVYFECRMLCDMTMTGMLRAARAIPNLSIGTDYDVIFVSFDAKETAASASKKRDEIVPAYTRPNAPSGFHFLTADEASVQKLADTAGFSFAWDASTNQWAHSAALMVLTPEGKISKYFYGVEYSARDLRLGLVDASNFKIGTLTDKILLFCYHYDPVQGKYGMMIMSILRWAGALTVFGIALAIVWSVRQENNRKKHHGQGIPAYTR